MVCKNLILIEPDATVATQILTVCDRLAFDVHVFGDALDALIQAVGDRPELLLFDADAAAVGSLELADVIARDPRLASIPLVAIVDPADRDSLRKYEARGVGIVTPGRDGGRNLRGQLLHLLRPYADGASCHRQDRRRSRQSRGAA